MSLLEAYKGIVSQVYKLTQLSYQHHDTINEFDSFLDHLQDVLEHKQQQTIHIPPHVEIINEPVVVVKDDTVKNITLRHIPPSTEIQEDECLEDREEREENEFIPETPVTSVEDDVKLARDAIDATLDEEEVDIAQEIADAEAEGEEALAQNMAELNLEQEKEQEEDEEDEEDKDLYIKTFKKVKYFVSAESKRVYQYIDETRKGPLVGKLENGKIVLM
jgi:hypothetical protein